MLSHEELAKASTFYFERDRYQYLLARVLVRTVLSGYCGLAPEALRFETDSMGRPTIAPTLAGVCGDLDFNLSHTPGLVVVAVARGRRIGVDVERLRRPAPLRLADRLFAEYERRAMLSLPHSEQPSRFFKLWTLKESYIKARGLGLRIPLRDIEFSFCSDDGIKLRLASSLLDVPDRWSFSQFHPTQDYVVAVCAEQEHPKEEIGLIYSHAEYPGKKFGFP